MADLHLISLNTLEHLEAYKKALSPDETDRMLRFATPRLQEKFALTRGALRFILSDYLDSKPEDIRFRYNEFGKPFLATGFLQFNMAHSGDYCVMAVTEKDLIGVDIEKCEDTHKPHFDIAKRFFTAPEFQAIEKSTDPETLFFHIWTQKEAFLKAIGRGLSFGLDQFEVATDLNQSYVRNIQDSEYASRIWASQSFDFLPQYRITLTKEHPILDLQIKS